MSYRHRSALCQAAPILLALSLVLMALGCSPSQPAVQSLDITIPVSVLAIGATEQLTVSATYADGTSQAVSSQVTWTSSNTGAITVSQSGLATAVAAGSASITAAFAGQSTTSVLTVGAPAPTLSSILVTTAASVTAGAQVQATAAGTYSDGSSKDITGQVSWTSSDLTLATISAAGLVQAVSVGTVSITATLGSVSGSGSITVTSPTLSGIAITPVNASIFIVSTLTQQLTATATYSDGSVQDVTGQVQWASTDQTIAAVSNDPGSAGLATAASAGSVTITATLGEQSGSATLTVSSAALVSIALSPPDSTLIAGTSQQLAAAGTYDDGSVVDITALVVWYSSDDTVVTVSNIAGTQGLATALGTGTATISAMNGGITGTTTVTAQ